MNFYEFTLLSDDDQFTIIFLEGHFINFREIKQSIFALYKHYGFFVEIEYEISQNRIVGKVVFQTN